MNTTVGDYRVCMDRRILKAAIGLALALCAMAWAAGVAGAAHGKGAHAASALLGGVNIIGVGDGSRPQEADGAIAQASALHAKVVRTEVPWSVFEPQGPEQISATAQAFTDRLVSDAAAAGIRVIMTVDSTPCWASSAPSSLLSGCQASDPNDATSWQPSAPNYADYAGFVAYLARRYGTQLAAIEVWNEPDQSNEAYWAGPNKTETYAALLRAAYPAIKQADPHVMVLGGSLVGSNGLFLSALYAAGIKGYYDGLAVHYYSRLTLDEVREIHEVQLANGDTKPLWLDEFGWSSCWPELREQEQLCVTEQIQATNLANTLRTLARTPYVAAAVSYKLQDSSQEDFGLLSASGAHKLAFSAFAHALASPLGSISSVTLGLRRHGGQVLASGSAPVGDFMELEAFRGKRLRYRTGFMLDQFNRYSISLPAAVGTHGLRVRVYQFWTGPSRDAQKSI